MSKKETTLNLFKLIMITLAFIMSIRNLPLLAETGWQQVFFMVLAAVVFLIPTALLSAELATGWPKAGGVYQWIKLAFGDRLAFIGAWMLWVQMFFGMVMIGSFIAAMIAYIFDPALASNNYYIAAVIIVLYWIVTLLNFKGLRSGAIISSVGFVVGVLIPFALILIFGIAYYMGSNPIQLPPFSWERAIPDFTSMGNLSLFAGFIFVYAGVEVSSVHANQVSNVRRNYPLAMLIAAILLISLNVFGAFAIEISEPRNDINLASGIMQAFTKILEAEGFAWLKPVMALMIGIGAFGQLSTWVLGPSKAMLQVAKNGYMPKWWHKTNKEEVPVRFLLVQATVITLVALLYVVVPSVNAGFFMVLILTTILYAIMYILMYASGIKLRYKYPDVKRAYTIPGGKLGIWLVAGLGLIGMVFTIIVSVIPPESLSIGSPTFYVIFQLGGLLIFLIIPIIIYSMRKPSWKAEDADIED